MDMESIGMEGIGNVDTEYHLKYAAYYDTVAATNLSARLMDELNYAQQEAIDFYNNVVVPTVQAEIDSRITALGDDPNNPQVGYSYFDEWLNVLEWIEEPSLWLGPLASDAGADASVLLQAIRDFEDDVIFPSIPTQQEFLNTLSFEDFLDRLVQNDDWINSTEDFVRAWREYLDNSLGGLTYKHQVDIESALQELDYKFSSELGFDIPLRIHYKKKTAGSWWNKHMDVEGFSAFLQAIRNDPDLEAYATQKADPPRSLDVEFNVNFSLDSSDWSNIPQIYADLNPEDSIDTGAPGGTINSPYNVMVSDFDTVWNVTATSTGPNDFADWGGVLSVVATDANKFRWEVWQDLREAAGAKFCEWVSRRIQDGKVIDTTTFDDAWEEFIRATTQIDVSDPAFTGAIQADFACFQRTFFAFRPNATQADFEEELGTLIYNLIYEQEYQESNDYYFLPSHFIEPWIDQLKVDVLYPTPPTTVNPSERQRQAKILEDVFALLIEMIEVIQQAAIAAGERLEFYGEWQKRYTDLMAQMPTFALGDGTALDRGAGDKDDVEAMANLNQITQSSREMLRSYRDIIGDEVQQQQTTVNQLNDAASQQASIATAILQQLQGILTMIFR